jgi:aryl-alcohol dehydrogenase-like predicted oxidoreductase
MDQRAIGQVSVSVVGLGCNQLGTARCDEETGIRIVHEALDAGVTFFDTADEYGSNYFDPDDPRGWGHSEEILGRALGHRRDEVVIGSKFGARPHGHPDRGGSSERWATIAVEDSLRRLGTDRIDLYQVHFPDPDVPEEETLGFLDGLVRAGKVREIGCCNYSGEALVAADKIAGARGLRRYASAQNLLNVLQRGALDDVLPASDRLDMAFIPYYPLASGMLSGKYRRGEPLPAGTRLVDQVDDEARGRLFSERTFARLEALEAFARERGHTLLDLAFAWLLGHPSVATVIAGAATPGQVSANSRAAGWRMTLEEVAQTTRTVTDAVAGSAPAVPR